MLLGAGKDFDFFLTYMFLVSGLAIIARSRFDMKTCTVLGNVISLYIKFCSLVNMFLLAFDVIRIIHAS